MFKKCFLHIGHPKTGTSALQRTLYSHRDHLSSNGIYYSGLSANHRFFVSFFHQNPEEFDYNVTLKRGKKEIGHHHLNMLTKFESAFQNTTLHNTLVISSEHMVLLNENALNNCADYLNSIAESTSVICYVRHPVSCASSFAQESVKRGARTLQKIIERPEFFRFKEQIPKFENAFGKTNLILKEYSPKSLSRGNILADFLDIIGYTGNVEALKIDRIKLGLSAPAVLIANELTRQIPKFSNLRGPIDYLHKIQGPKFQLPLDCLINIRNQAKPHLEFLKENYNITLKECSSPKPNLQDHEFGFSEETIASIALLLNSMSVELNHLRKSNTD